MGEGKNPFFDARYDNGDSAEQFERIEAVCVDVLSEVDEALLQPI